MLWGVHVAVVVPAYDEERLIARTLCRMPREVDSIYVVDDASRDDTWSVLQRQSDPRVRRIRHARNRGVGAAIVSGYYRALAEGAQVLVVMAADAQMDPGDLPVLVEPVARGQCDYCKGNRFRHREQKRMPLLRRWGSKTLALATRLCTGLQVDDTQCGYTALSADCAASLPLDSLWPRYGYPNDLLALLARNGSRVAEVPVRPLYADERSGLRPWHAVLILGLILRRWARDF